jgi:hypothetical protein
MEVCCNERKNLLMKKKNESNASVAQSMASTAGSVSLMMMLGSQTMEFFHVHLIFHVALVLGFN